MRRRSRKRRRREHRSRGSMSCTCVRNGWVPVGSLARGCCGRSALGGGPCPCLAGRAALHPAALPVSGVPHLSCCTSVSLWCQPFQRAAARVTRAACEPAPRSCACGQACLLCPPLQELREQQRQLGQVLGSIEERMARLEDQIMAASQRRRWVPFL